MPEIKHNFTRGKMNKDLDERLVPNGEYRDAMNIQVSTSEESDVGTVQNILGNSLVRGQDFIGPNGFCVGSIADEKNDKLYWLVADDTGNLFTVNQREFGPSNNKGSRWTVVPSSNSLAGDPWIFNYKSAQASTAIPGADGYLATYIPELVPGITYTFEYNIRNSSADPAARLLIERNAVADHVELEIENGRHSVTGEFYYDPTASNVFTNENFRIRCNDSFDGELSDFKIVRSYSYILEHDTKSSDITPVFVDIGNKVLQFKKSRLITGINIIDDMMFFTDNFSEPKKININRCKQGTNPNGLEHTRFINEDRDITYNSDIHIKEEHITVIKEKPLKAPTINVLGPRSDESPSNTYAGAMFITQPPDIPLVKFADNTQNQSSLWRYATNEYNHYYDFSLFTIGTIFRTEINTTVFGESGFYLNWEDGDTVVFKEFGGPNYDEPPQLPITDYRIKAKILNIDPSDSKTEFLNNGDLSVLSTSASIPFPKYWSRSSNASNVINFFPNNRLFDFDVSNAFVQANGAVRINTQTKYKLANGNTYTLRFTVSDYVHGQGAYVIALLNNQDNDTKFPAATAAQQAAYSGYTGAIASGDWVAGVRLPSITGNGNFEYTFTVDTSWFGTADRDTNKYVGVSAAHSLVNDKGTFYIQTYSATGFEAKISNFSLERDADEADVKLEVTDINGIPPTAPAGFQRLQYAVDKYEEQDEYLFQFKFPRFGYRYKYEDNEYSAFSPFSQVGFLPGAYDYSPKKGFNLAMQNLAKEIKIENFTENIPDGVKSIDLLYKDDASPEIYVIESINNTSSDWTNDSYSVKAETIKQLLPSNQLLRPFDVVPRKALAQDISGNRIIYGNYLQNYNTENILNQLGDFYFAINKIDRKPSDAAGAYQSMQEDSYANYWSTILGDITGAAKSIKSLREYQMGVVFIDKYGRETPVLTSAKATIKLDKSHAKTANKIEISFNNGAFLENMEYFKFFIKETSGEYYNLAMDRYYESEVENEFYLSFNSADRNKIDEDSFIILKKAAESNIAVTKEAKFKILSILNEAPDYVKETKLKVTSVVHSTNNSIFDPALVGAFGPIFGIQEIELNYAPFNGTSGAQLENIGFGNLYFELEDRSTGQSSKRYRVANLVNDFDGSNGSTATYRIILETSLGTDVNFACDDASGVSPTKINDNVAVNFYNHKPENQSKFDGRFFVKITGDPTFTENVVIPQQQAENYRVALSKQLFSSRPEHNDLHDLELMGWDSAARSYRNVDDNGNGFGKWAAFFRNYNMAPNGATMKANDGTTNLNVGQFMHNANNQKSTSAPNNDQINASKAELYAYLDGWPWVRGSHYKFESEHYYATDEGFNSRWKSGYTSSAAGNVYKAISITSPGLKAADQHDGEDAIWFIDNGPVKAHRFADDLAWKYTHNSSFTNMGGIKASGSSNHISISMGGIYHVDGFRPSPAASGWNTLGDGQVISNFFDIGVDGGNPNYQDTATVQLVRRLSSGSKWRFKEDPSGETFDVINTVDYRSLRGAHNHTNETDRWDVKRNGSYDRTPWTTPYNNSFGSSNTPDTSPVGTSGNYELLTGTGSSYPYKDAYGEVHRQLSPNFTRNWRLYNDLSNMSWNPMASSLGPISNGISISLKLVTSTISATSGATEITLKLSASSAADNITGVNHVLTRGMILTRYNSSSAGDSGGVALDGSIDTAATDKQELLIHNVQVLSSGNAVITMTGYRRLLTANTPSTQLTSGNYDLAKHHLFDTAPTNQQYMTFKQPVMNGYSKYSVNRINAQDWNSDGWDKDNPGIGAVSYEIQFLEPILLEETDSASPAIWETEPKKSKQLDIYHEASDAFPTSFESKNAISTLLPIGSTVKHWNRSEGYLTNFIPDGVTIVSYVENNGIRLSEPVFVNQAAGINDNDHLYITRPDGTNIRCNLSGFGTFTTGDAVNGTLDEFFIDGRLLDKDNTRYRLNWYNCFSFENGVESNRIRDTFNLPFISNGTKVSTVLEDQQQEDNRTSGLIYSGIYNSNTGINELNQFIAAEKITKDVNPIYGSIQKLHARDTDLITLCEDKALKILANKDAVFNADGNPQLTANQNVLGQTIPFVGEYGISTNPESFASQAYRIYFADRVRGAVMRLSRDGLTPISDAGMKDWFRDNLSINIGKDLLRSSKGLITEPKWSIADTLGNGVNLAVQPSPPNSWRIENGVAIGSAGSYGKIVTRVNTGDLALGELIAGRQYEIIYDIVKGCTVFPGSYPLKLLGVAPGNDNIGLLPKKLYSTTWTPGSLIGTYRRTWTQTSGEFFQGSITQGAYSQISILKDQNFDGGITNITIREIKAEPEIIGSYDDKKQEYNITIRKPANVASGGLQANTVSFKEDVRGWVSFKSFTPENAISCANEYFTMNNGKLWKHHSEEASRNTFYNDSLVPSSVEVVLNDFSGTIKSFHALSYEGSQANVDEKTQSYTNFSATDLNLSPDFTDWTIYNTEDFGQGVGWEIGSNTRGPYIQAADYPDHGFIELIVPEIVEGNTYKIIWELGAPTPPDFPSGTVTMNGNVRLGKPYLSNHKINANGVLQDINLTDLVGGNLSVATPLGYQTFSAEWVQGPVNTGKIVIACTPAYNGRLYNIRIYKQTGTTIRDDNYYNIRQKTGWQALSINTDQQKGTLNEFINKQGKWFNYIKGSNLTELQDISFNIEDFGDRSIQGIGRVADTSNINLQAEVLTRVTGRGSNNTATPENTAINTAAASLNIPTSRLLVFREDEMDRLLGTQSWKPYAERQEVLSNGSFDNSPNNWTVGDLNVPGVQSQLPASGFSWDNGSIVVNNVTMQHALFGSALSNITRNKVYRITIDMQSISTSSELSVVLVDSLGGTTEKNYGISSAGINYLTLTPGDETNFDQQVNLTAGLTPNTVYIKSLSLTLNAVINSISVKELILDQSSSAISGTEVLLRHYYSNNVNDNLFFEDELLLTLYYDPAGLGTYAVNELGTGDPFRPNLGSTTTNSVLTLSGNRLHFSIPINSSLSIGDKIYSNNVSSVNGSSVINVDNLNYIGEVIYISEDYIDVSTDGGVANTNSFVYFAKNQKVNSSSLKGYYASVTFSNESTEKIELFSISSEITESGK